MTVFKDSFYPTVKIKLIPVGLEWDLKDNIQIGKSSYHTVIPLNITHIFDGI